MLGQLCGSAIFDQPRNAFNRQSRSHLGSPFLAEISLTMSSFRPRGATSDSISVTKPYLYSLLTSVSTGELMRSPPQVHQTLQGAPGTRTPCIHSVCVACAVHQPSEPCSETLPLRRRFPGTAAQPPGWRSCAPSGYPQRPQPCNPRPITRWQSSSAADLESNRQDQAEPAPRDC